MKLELTPTELLIFEDGFIKGVIFATFLGLFIFVLWYVV